MSIAFRVDGSAKFEDVFGIDGLSEAIDEEATTKTSRCVTDGENYLWLYGDEDGTIHSATRYGMNDEEDILDKIHDALDIYIYCIDA